MTTDKSGNVPSTQATLPNGVSFGPDPITGTGATSQRVGSVPVYVSNNDPQLGYGPDHTGMETNDNVIARYQAVSTSSKLTQDWSMAGIGKFNTTPAFSGGTAYIGDTDGDLYAVNQTSGAPLFTDSLGSGIGSSPAVASGDVIVGDDAGDLEAVNATSGASVWTASIGGALTSPAVLGGVAYVASASGRVAAVDVATGATAWNVSAGDGFSTVPAVDPVTGDVIVTSQTGAVTMLSPTTGVAVWTETVGGVPTSAMITSDKVYIGSSDGSLYAFNVATGKALWSAATGSSITAAPIVAYGRVTVGNAGGSVSYFDATSGALINTQAFFGHPITGITSTKGIILLTSPWGLGMIEGPHYVRMTWLFRNTAGYSASGVFLNGDMFVAGADGLLRGFTTPGRAMA